LASTTVRLVRYACSDSINSLVIAMRFSFLRYSTASIVYRMS